jgi:hypothetical protein
MKLSSGLALSGWKPGANQAKKNERPVGVPAALAWGDGGYLAGRSVVRLRGSRLFDCAREQQNNAQEQDCYDHSTHPLPNLTSIYSYDCAEEVRKRL